MTAQYARSVVGVHHMNGSWLTTKLTDRRMQPTDQQHEAAMQRRWGAQAESAQADSVQRVVVPLPVDDLWALWRDLSEQARVLEETGAIFRVRGVERRTSGQSWTAHIKTAIQREGKARRLRERARQYKALYWKERHNNRINDK